MPIAVDLHSHSNYAGGAGNIDIKAIADTMSKKGIHVYGIGDCLFAPWRKEYQKILIDIGEGVYSLPGTSAKFIRQTEVIFTAALSSHRHRIIAHHIILLPDEESIAKMLLFMQQRGIKNTIARPFIVCRDEQELVDDLFTIQAIHPLIEIIPAHILTPDGILGSKNGLSTWTEFYGAFTPYIHAVETGLSADPDMLCRIPDLQNMTYISNSDCHSSALNRIGREFTILDVEKISYPEIIRAIRQNKIQLTAEFLPSEGRYYLTGHRADRHENHQAVFFSDDQAGADRCPFCNKPLLQGARDRARLLSDSRIIPLERNFLHLIPLIEVIAHAHHTKSIASVKVTKDYHLCLKVFSTEIELWTSSNEKVQELLDTIISQEIVNQIVAVKNGNFVYDPPGFDGCYGNLKIFWENTYER
jgi:PHP family Zn ribbon phosphoesterase